MIAKQSASLSIFLTLLVAMALRIVPLPETLASFNPDWVLLVLIYWSLAVPERVGVFTGFVIGLLIDVLTGRLLGQNALIYALICYFVVKLHKRIRHYPIPQQSLFVFFCLLLACLLTYWIENLQATHSFSLNFWFPVVSGSLFWPVVFLLLHSIRIRG